MFDWLVDTSQFSTRAACSPNGELAGILGQIFVIGAIMSIIGYALLTVSLFLFRRTELARKTHWLQVVCLLFETVFLLCAASRLCGVLSFYWPAYRVFAVIEILTGCVSFSVSLFLFAILVVYCSLKEARRGTNNQLHETSE